MSICLDSLHWQFHNSAYNMDDCTQNIFPTWNVLSCSQTLATDIPGSEHTPKPGKDGIKEYIRSFKQDLHSLQNTGVTSYIKFRFWHWEVKPNKPKLSEELLQHSKYCVFLGLLRYTASHFNTRSFFSGIWPHQMRQLAHLYVQILQNGSVVCTWRCHL